MMAYGKKTETHTICGEPVRIRALLGSENSERIIDLSRSAGVNPKAIVELGALLALECLVDDQGAPVFSSVDDARKQCSLGFLKDIIEPALTVSGLGDDAKEVADLLPADR